MLQKPSFRFRYIVYVLTGLCVLSFQSWWLWDSYSLRRKALLDRVSTETKQYLNVFILQQLAPRLSINGDDTSEIDLSGIFGNSEYSKADTQTILQAREEMAKGPSSISVNIRTPVPVLNLEPDSQIYAILRDVVPELHDSSDLIVYMRNAKITSSYPRHAPVIENASTEWIDTETRRFGSLRVHVTGMFRKILPEMIPAILFSLLYLCLFLWTILALVRTARENRRLLESKADFTQNMTHELKIPISGLFLATEALERFNDVEDPQKARRHVATIRKGLYQLSTLVDRILNSARLQQRQVRLQRSVITLRPMLLEICGDINGSAEECRANIDVGGVPESAAIYADPEQFRYVLSNLIDNAIKYTPGTAIVNVRLLTDGPDCVIEIQDHGIGIAASYHERIFEAYFRVPQHDRHDVKGYGLGLSIVRQIVELHDGSVKVLRSGPGGTIFQIRIPRHDR
jgi:two-component system phosphate regulon sensor histidine kinase PhoR